MKASSGTGVTLSVAFALPIIIVQFASLQIVAFATTFALLLLTFVVNAASGRNLHRAFFVTAFLFLLFILYQVRPDVFQVWGAMDAMFLLPVVGMMLAAASLPQTNSELLYRIIYYASVVLCIAWIGLHFAGIYPSALVFPPYAGTRWVGGFDGPNEFGAFYALIMALGFGLYLEGKLKLTHLVVGTAALAVCIWYSFSRGTLISVGVLGLMVAFLNFLGRDRWRLLFVGVGILAVAGIYFDRFTAAFLNVRKARSGRDALLDTAIESFMRDPIFGRGFGYFDSIAGLPPHSDYFYFIVSGGVIGLAVLLASFGYLIWGAYRRGMYTEFLFFVVFAVHSLSFNNLVRGRLSVIFWLVTCVALVKFVRWDQFRQFVSRMPPVTPYRPTPGGPT